MVKNILELTFIKTSNYDSLKRMRDKAEKELEKQGKTLTQAQKDLEAANKKRNLAVREIKDYVDIVEVYLGDKQQAEAQYKELSRILKETVKSGKRLSKIENLVINEEIIPPVCSTPYKDKISYASDHVSPRGGERFVERIAECPYVSKVTRIKLIKNIRSDRLKKIENNGKYTLQAVFTDKTREDCVEIMTTAKTEIQQDFIYRLLKREMKIKS